MASVAIKESDSFLRKLIGKKKVLGKAFQLQREVRDKRQKQQEVNGSKR